MSMSTSGAKAMSDCSLKVQLERRSAALRADASRTALSKGDVFGVVMFIGLQLYSHFEFAIGFFEVVCFEQHTCPVSVFLVERISHTRPPNVAGATST